MSLIQERDRQIFIELVKNIVNINSDFNFTVDDRSSIHNK